jgi:RNA polymerase sigma factor (TIGR02999 family)
MDVTFLLSRAQQGDVSAERQVAPLIYERLRIIARSLMRSEKKEHTLQATALVNELFLRKLPGIKTPLHDREHFFSLASNAMRQVLIEHARRRNASRRVRPESVAELLLIASQSTSSDAEDLFAIRQRFVKGFTITQTAQRLNRPAWRVRADSDFGLTWMARQLTPSRAHRPG